MTKVNIERIENLTPEELEARAREIEAFVKKDYREHRAMMNALAEGPVDKKPEIIITDYRTVEKYLHSLNYYGFLDSKTYIISFYGEEEHKVNFKDCKAHVCQILLDDVIAKDYDKFYEEHKDTFIILARFIVNAVANGNRIICQCEAGVSRSAGVAKAIKEYFFGTGSEIDKDGSYVPNDLFFQCVLRAILEIE